MNTENENKGKEQAAAGMSAAAQPQPAPARTGTETPEKGAQPGGRKPYRPTEKVRALLEEIFVPEIMEMCEKSWGLNLHKLVDSVKEYGVLEALAYSQWTPPIKCYPPFNPPGVPQYWSIRISHTKDEKTGKVTVKYETPVPIRTMIRRDNNNVERLKFDRRTLKFSEGSHSLVMYDHKHLTREQVKELLLYGTLSNPLERMENGVKVREVVQSHPYNTERIITIPCDTLRKRMLRPENRAFKADDGETFDLTDTQATELSVGHIVKLGLDHFVRYDIMKGKVREVENPEKAKEAFSKVEESWRVAREELKEKAGESVQHRTSAGIS